MSLQKILLDIGSELGIDVTNTTQREWVIEKINDAALEVYTSQDIPGCLREITFNIDSDTQQSSLVSLPYYVGEIRGIRPTQMIGAKVPLQTMRPRYSLGKGWDGNIFNLSWREVRSKAMFKRDVSNASVLTFTLEDVETRDVEIYIVGATTNSERSTELVTITAGQLTADSIYQYVEVPQNIEKTGITGNNITITDVDGNELAVIPNNQLKPAYKWIELQDNNASLGQVTTFRTVTAYDMLFKMEFVPLKNLYDEFLCPNCDRVVFYKFMQYYESQQPGKEQRALFAKEQCDKLLSQMNLDTEQGKELELSFGRNGYSDAQDPFANYKFQPYGGVY